jgi:thiol-disulfide isomerase/thioredoxin
MLVTEASVPRSMTKNTLASLGLALALVVAACSGSDGHADTGLSDEALATTVAVDEHPAAPPTGFAMFDGTSATLADYGGKPLVVNFWASWCPSCVAEMAAAFKPAQERVGDDVAFLGLNIQDDRADALRLVEETGVLFDLGDDPLGDLYVELGGIGMPFTVFINTDGRIVEQHNGPLTEAQLLDLIEEAFAT